MENTKNYFIKTEDLCASYEEDDGRAVQVLSGVSLGIEKGEYVAVLGHNGSGKSTFAKLLNMILLPDSGKIYIDGTDITREDITEKEIYDIRRKIGMVFQNPDNQLVATIVEEDVAFGPENLGIPSAEIRQRVDEALSLVGMSEYARHEPHRLSGGQKQRVAIAGIIAMMPDCMIFDESTAMLDPIGRKEVMDTIDMLRREKGITIINITHHMNEAVRADRVIVLNDGKVYMDGTPEEIFGEPYKLELAGLEVPQCTALIQELSRKGLRLDGECTTPEKCAKLLRNAIGGKKNG
ncbi:MAG: energy-coupling factor transporter ATPase [Clostridia bacterium]|nr:energy-coupling factor transporter ATPase [Clostridia bacterium]